MAEGQHEPLTENEMAELAQKLKTLGNNLTPKEGRFLTEALESGIAMNRADEVQGYTMQSALQSESMYYPSSYRQEFGGGTPIKEAHDTTISIEVVGHFNAP